MGIFKKLCTLTAAAMLLSLPSCGDSPEQKELNKQNLARAEKNAVEYVHEKYGIKAKAVDSILERRYGMFNSTPLTTALVTLEYDGEAFHVYIDGEEENTDGADDYQLEQLQDAVYMLIDDAVPGLKGIHIEGGSTQDVAYDPIEDYCDNLYKTYFNGENLTEILSESYCRITADYVETDFSSVTDWSFASEYLDGKNNAVLNMISYRSEEAYKDHSDSCGFSEKHAMYVDGYCSFENSEKKTGTYEIKEYGEIYYCVTDGDPDAVRIGTTEPAPASQWDGRGAYQEEFLTDAYSIDCGEEYSITVFCPVSEFGKYSGDSDFSFAWCAEKDGEPSYTARSASIVGDYAVYTIGHTADAAYFAFMTD